ncbi:hypothetical protein JOQ06_024358 [Pogonophryne albipinna]|uniref:Uncharacterized protein n=1 Tax=Pogonophryne albipinna TaxID=1090488 RepID=A0AAD6A5S6_9TELE|nr:hypothetical protein JOQ06_024358 [Pogonophryne albipinna]
MDDMWMSSPMDDMWMSSPMDEMWMSSPMDEMWMSSPMDDMSEDTSCGRGKDRFQKGQMIGLHQAKNPTKLLKPLKVKNCPTHSNHINGSRLNLFQSDGGIMDPY